MTIWPEMTRDNLKKNNFANYALNLRSVLATQMNGGSHTDLKRVSDLLGLRCFTFKTYKNVEKRLGNVLRKVSKQSMKEVLEEEIKRSPLTYSTEEYGTLPALVVLVDMGWQKRAAGRLYNSPSGVLHVIGAYTKKIHSFVYRNTCTKCKLVESLIAQLSNLDEENDGEKSMT